MAADIAHHYMQAPVAALHQIDEIATKQGTAAPGAIAGGDPHRGALQQRLWCEAPFEPGNLAGLLADMQAREVARLERSLAPEPLLEGSSVWVASRYRAGRSRALLGGDFVDLVERSDGSLHVVVGDVCGHGPDEAAIGVSLRAAWRALVLAGERPDKVLATLQHVFEHERHLPGLFATLCTLEVQGDLRSASIICAGHPRPALIDGSSIAAISSGPGGAGIGIGDSHWHSERVSLQI